MRNRLATPALIGALIGALAFGPALAATPSPQPATRPVPQAVPASPTPQSATPKPAAAAPDPALVFYPTAARAAGVEGSAVIRCVHDEHMRVIDCTLVSETPAGQGFGAAAMAMAAQAPGNPKLNFADERAKPPQDIEIHFTLRPPEIRPDITTIPHVVARPAIVSAPNNTQIQAAYPERALADQVEGKAAMDCMVMADGKLARCQIAGELPAGYGFGQATLDLAGDFVMKPRTVDGDPVSGATVRVGVAFSTTDPTAPLSLGLKPKP
jgi:TonB family protein